MRTTITIDDDVYAEMQRMRRDQGLGPSVALNTLARRGMLARPQGREPYVHEARAMGARVDLSNIGEVLDLLDEPGRPQ